MRKLFVVIAVVMGFYLVWPAQAQIVNPVRLKINKNSKKDRKTTYQSTYGTLREQDVNETVSYTVDVINMSSGPVKDVEVKWAILVNARGRYSSTSYDSGMRVVEGERKVDELGIGQKFSFDTDVIQLSGTQTDGNSSYYYGGTSRTKTGSEIAGYVVEVYSGGRVIGSEILPIDTKKKIAALKAPKKPDANAEPPRQKF